MNQKGFTLIELCMVICIIGVLAVTAIPLYYNIVGQANVAAEQGVVGGVRSGIYTYMANQISNCTVTNCVNPYPTRLDLLSAGTLCTELNPCFTEVLGQGGITSQWKKVTNMRRYKNLYSGHVYKYNETNGNFTRV